MKDLLLCIILSLVITILLGRLVIPILKRIKAGQPILKYVSTHKDKNGTPTMGGLFFILPSIVVFYIFNGFENLACNVSVAITLAFMVVGFMDDFIKIKVKDNQGLKVYQKIIFQLGIALIAGFFAYRNGLTNFYLPFSKSAINLGFWTIPLVAIVFIAITNSVNLTDGLDSLSSSVSIVYLAFLSLIIFLQSKINGFNYFLTSENQGLILLSLSFIGGILGFLVYNSNKASVFMGDTGSLALGGLIGSVSVFSCNTLLIPLLGITFVASSLSVIIQVIVYKAKKKRVFLMAPLHHHFQLKGYSESKISYIYSLITGIIGTFLIISYL